MTRKTIRKSILLLTVGMLMLAGQGNAQTVDDQLKIARSAINADRKATVAAALQLTEAEAKAFWPLHDQYRAEIGIQGDALLQLIKEYARLYPNVSDDQAKAMLKTLTNLEQRRVAIRSSYLKKIEAVMSPAKTLRFAQVDTRLDLALQMQVLLASDIPLVPIEGRMTGEATGVVVAAEGVPGGIVVATYELTATVAAVDKASRKVTLVDAAGIKKTVKAGPHVINFDQIKVGDQLKITATEDLVVYVAGPGETPADSSAQVVALAPKGAKPGAILAETTRVTAKVTAIDATQHKATLQFEDGTTRTVTVRPDVDLGKRKVGDTVIIQITETLAINLAKP